MELMIEVREAQSPDGKATRPMNQPFGSESSPVPARPHPAELSCSAGAFQAFISYRVGWAMIQASDDRRAGGQRRNEPGPKNSMSKKLSIPQSGRIGTVVNAITRYGQVERQFVPPRNPQATDQQAVRGNFGRVSARWRVLTPEQRAAWRTSPADSYTMGRMGRKVALNGYNYFVRINSARLDIGLNQFDVPPEVPIFKQNPVEELLISNNGGIITLKLRVPALPAEHTIVQAAAPCSPGISRAQHFPCLGFLPAPTDGWSDITALYVDWYGVPPAGQAVWIRTRQHINGWNDLPKQILSLIHI